MKTRNKLILSITSLALSITLISSGILYIAFDAPVPSINKTEVQNNMIIEKDAFFTPDNKYRSMPIVHDFANVSGETYADKMEYLKSCGAGGLITNDGWSSRYLTSERTLENLNDFIKEATNAGLRVWLYDEKGYPSGSAGDLVCKDNPEYQAINLLQLTKTGNGSGEVRISLPENFIKLNSVSILSDGRYIQATASVVNNEIIFNGVDGAWTAYVYYVEKFNHDNQYAETYPNLLNKDAVKKFIDVTYETYYQHIDNFEDIIEAFFTDEPSLTATTHANSGNQAYVSNPAIPYDYDIFETFEEKFGYDLVPLLPLVFNSQSEEAQRVRANFYSHVGDILSESFFGQIQAWCEAHGTKFSGHILLEEEMKYHIPLYGDYIRCSAEMGYSGFDILNVRPANYIQSMSTGGKYASSPAWLLGKERVFVEICPVADSKEFATNHLDYALGTMTFAYFDGANQVGSYYGKANYDVETGNAFNNYVGRLGSMLVGAQNKNNIAVYYAIDSVAGAYTSPLNRNIYKSDQFARINDNLVNEITLELRASGYDYVFLDDNSIQQGEITDSALKVNDFNFNTIIVPRATIIDVETMRTFGALIQKGVNVIFVGAMPTLSFLEGDQAELENLSKKYSSNCVATATKAVEAITAPVKLTVTSRATVYVSPYEKDGIEFYYLANASGTSTTAIFNYENAQSYRIYDPLTGEITEVASEYKIPSYRGIFVQPIIQQ